MLSITTALVKIRREILQLVVISGILFSPHFSFSQIVPNINSGNPVCPFPQFQAYTGAPNTLANNNPVGVPHAEMEQRIRDAYTIMCNNLTYNIAGGAPITVAGVKYINPLTAATTNCTCAESDGYFLLAAAYMGDKTTFDGYFMWAHDRGFQKIKRYVDGVVNSPGYNYSPGIEGAGSFGAPETIGGGLGGNSAGDGDVDIALALLVAWKQWGDLSGITPPATGVQISYKQEAINYIMTLTDTVIYAPSLPIKTYVTGDIGMDGYMKGGDSWGEETNWAAGGYLGLKSQTNGPQTNYVDYYAPAYFRSFGDMLTAEGLSPWCINQYRRAEAAGDWIIGQAIAQGYIPWAGQYSVNGTAVTFSNFNASEDHRFAWRTILNYAWHGPPVNTWNPTTHTYAAGTNTYELQAATKLATFIKNTNAAPYNNACMTYNTLSYGGPANLRWSYTLSGTGQGAFPLNWGHGSGSPAAVVSGDADLMARMFRHMIIEWGQSNGGTQQYLTSQPIYFHEWFRLLGMLVLTGNLQDPMNFAGFGSNMKVYKSVDKTFAYTGDTITYTISYRNYASTAAANVTINDNLPTGLTFLSANKGGTATGSSVTWNIGTVPAFVTGGLAATIDSVVVKAIVAPTATGRLCNVATITTTNGTGWTSNEYPNNNTAVMQRNCVDILPSRPLSISKLASKTTVLPGDTISYTIKVKNNSVPFLNGGRMGVVVATGNNGVPTSNNSLYFKYRIYHGAHEAYINYQNYRVSYYLNKTLAGAIPSWVLSTTINEGVGTTPTLTQEALVPGATWNQRFILQFPNQLATITPFLYMYSGNAISIHQGALMPQRLVAYIHDATWANWNWSTDWSSETTISAADGDPYWPIANDWTDPLLPNQPVLKYSPDACSNNVTTTSTKQLVEEWDGYTWRRIYGNAPVTGREIQNIVITDNWPAALTFGGYFPGTPTGTMSGNTITWPTVPLMRIGDSIVYKVWGTVKNNAYFGCGTVPTPSSFTNTANVSALNESATSSSASTTVKCPVAAPVTLIYFNGTVQNSNAILSWATANEQNNDHFVVMKSYDGIHFDSLANVKGNGNSSTVNSYSYTDKSVDADIIYYKLIQVDYNGNQTSSNIVSLQNDNYFKLLVYPNPFSNEVNVKMVSSANKNITIKVIAVTGNVVYQSDQYSTNEVITLGADLASGVYIVQVIDGEDIQTVRLVKSK